MTSAAGRCKHPSSVAVNLSSEVGSGRVETVNARLQGAIGCGRLGCRLSRDRYPVIVIVTVFCILVAGDAVAQRSDGGLFYGLR